MNLDESTGISRQMMILALVFQGIHLLRRALVLPAAFKSTEKETKPGNVLSKRRGSVAAHLRSLRADDPVSKRHPRPIKQKLELCQNQTYFRNY